MPPVLTTAAVITCIHGGQVALIPRQSQVILQGAPALCEPDLVGAPIVGCPQPPSPSTKPCTLVVSILPGSVSLKVNAAGRPAYLATLVGVTDGVPPGALIVAASGQALVQA